MIWWNKEPGHQQPQYWPNNSHGIFQSQYLKLFKPVTGVSSDWFFKLYNFKATFTHARGGCGAEAGGFWHFRSATAGMFTHTRSGRGWICHFLRTMMVWSARFRSGRGKLGVGPISCGADFAPAPPPLRDRACMNTCNDLCWSQFSARLRPCPPAYVWTYL